MSGIGSVDVTDSEPPQVPSRPIGVLVLCAVVPKFEANASITRIVYYVDFVKIKMRLWNSSTYSLLVNNYFKKMRAGMQGIVYPHVLFGSWSTVCGKVRNLLDTNNI
jgi:hypothetical protein